MFICNIKLGGEKQQRTHFNTTTLFLFTPPHHPFLLPATQFPFTLRLFFLGAPLRPPFPLHVKANGVCVCVQMGRQGGGREVVGGGGSELADRHFLVLDVCKVIAGDEP